MSNEVIWYDSSETGAPVLNNVAGAMLAVLDACLINGFNVKSVTSIVVASNVATVTCTGHGYSGVYGKLVKISGATPAGLNGRKQITPTGVDSFTFPAPGISDQTATGTISARRAPLETWEKPYTGTNKAMYRSTDTGASGALLRVNDSNVAPATSTTARAIMVETASDIDTYTNQCPAPAHIADGKYIYKGDDSATAKSWQLIGDGRAFWLLTHGVGTTAYPFLFGDFKSYKAADSTNAIVGGPYAASLNNFAVYPCSITNADATLAGQNSILRSGNGVGNAEMTVVVPTIWMTRNFGTATDSNPPYPSIVDGGMVIAYPNLIQESSKSIRGEIPGLGYPAANIDALADMALITGLLNSGRTFMVSKVKSFPGEAAVVFDLTGPWR